MCFEQPTFKQNYGFILSSKNWLCFPMQAVNQRNVKRISKVIKHQN